MNLNQFKQDKTVGQVDLQTNPNPGLITCKFVDVDAGTAELIPGEGVILADLGASDPLQGNPIVDERAAGTDDIFGVKIYSTKENTSASGEIVQIAGKGTVVWMNAGAAVLRGASVELVLATPGNVITSAGTNYILGKALDKATAADQLIRVLIDPVAA